MDDRRGFIKNAAKIGLGSQLLFNTPLELIANNNIFKFEEFLI